MDRYLRVRGFFVVACFFRLRSRSASATLLREVRCVRTDDFAFGVRNFDSGLSSFFSSRKLRVARVHCSAHARSTLLVSSHRRTQSEALSLRVRAESLRWPADGLVSPDVAKPRKKARAANKASPAMPAVDPFAESTRRALVRRRSGTPSTSLGHAPSDDAVATH